MYRTNDAALRNTHRVIISRENTGIMKFRRSSEHHSVYENLLVWEFFDFRTDGFFVEIGANDPRELSQTWLLEKVGW